MKYWFKDIIHKLFMSKLFYEERVAFEEELVLQQLDNYLKK